MKEIKIIQDGAGKISVETTGEDGKIRVADAETIDAALETVRSEFGVSEEPIEEPEVEGEGEEMEMEMEMPSKGKTLGENLPAIDKDKIGMRPKKKADFSDYGI